MSDSPEWLAERLNSESAKTLSFFQSLTDDQWNVQVYEAGACWSVEQILSHFVATEIGIHRLLQNILNGGEGSPQDFDIDRYNASSVGKRQGRSRQEELIEFQLSRGENESLVRHMSADDLSRFGRHPFLGWTQVEEIVKLLYRHNQIHIRDMRHAIAATRD